MLQCLSLLVKVWPAMVINTVIGGMTFEVSIYWKQIILWIVNEDSFWNWIERNDVAYFLLTFDVCPLFLKNIFLSVNGDVISDCVIVTPETFCTLISRWSLLLNFWDCLIWLRNSFWIAAACFIADSRASEMSMSFCKDIQVSSRT